MINPWPFAIFFLLFGTFLLILFLLLQYKAGVKTHSYEKKSNKENCNPENWRRGLIGMICFKDDAPKKYPIWLKILFWTGWISVIISVLIFIVYSIWDYCR